MAKPRRRLTWREFFRVMFGPGPMPDRLGSGPPSRWDWVAGVLFIVAGVGMFVVTRSWGAPVAAVIPGALRLVRSAIRRRNSRELNAAGRRVRAST